MNKKAISIVLACFLLAGCSSSANLQEHSSEPAPSTASEPVSSEEKTIEFAGKTRDDFKYTKDLYSFYRGKECAVFKDHKLENDRYVTSSYDGETRTLASLYEFDIGMGSTELAIEIMQTFYDTVETAERNSMYQNLYFDWATLGGHPVAYWTLTRGADDDFHQTANIVWYDKHVEKAFNELMDR